MKKLIVILIILAFADTSIGQITLEKSYNYSATHTCIDNENYFYIMDVPLSQCRIYNSDHTLYKTININVPTGYYLSDIKYVSTHLFNNDDIIELLCVYEKYVTSSLSPYYKYGLSVVNESGTDLLTVPNGGWAEIKSLDDELKLFTYQYIFNSSGFYNVTTNIYQLDGTSDLDFFSELKSTTLYPNPAQSIINVSTTPEQINEFLTLTIYSVNGEKVFSKHIEDAEDQNLNIDFLPTGIYFYSLENKSGILKSSKLIIE